MTTSSKTLPATFVAWTRTTRATQTIGYYIAFVALGLVAASLGPTLTRLAENTHALVSQISYLFTARAFGYLVGSFIGGRLYDRMPGHGVMVTMLALMAVMAALVPVTSVLWLLIPIMWVLGFGEGAVDVGGNTLLVWVHGDKVGPFMNALHFFFGLGALVCPIIVAQVILLSGDITWAYWAVALLMLPAILWLVRVPSPPVLTDHQDGPVASVAARMIVLFVVFFFLIVGVEVSFGGWTATYARAWGFSAVDAAYLTSAFYGAFTAGRLLSIPLGTRFKPEAVLLCDLLGCLVGVILILAAPGSSAVLWLGTIVCGLAVAAMFPSAITIAGSRMPISGRVTAWFLVGSSLGGMTFPWLIGQLFEPVGPQVVMLLILTALMVALGVFWLFILHRKSPAYAG